MTERVIRTGLSVLAFKNDAAQKHFDGMVTENNLYNASICKNKAKTAIKEKDFDLAWKYLNEQKSYYLRHASGGNWGKLDTLALDSSVHLDMANVLRLEGKNLEALTHIAYYYVAQHAVKRPTKTIEEKLGTYFKRSKIDSVSLQQFISKLKGLKGDPQFVTVADLITGLK